MNFNRVSTRLKDVYLSEPYSHIQALRRCIKVLKGCNDAGRPILVLGSKNKFHFNNPSLITAVEHVGSQVTKQFCTQATSRYSLILCLDPLLYLPVLRNVSLPLMMVVTANDLLSDTDIAKVADYILPHTGGRIDSAIQHLLLSEASSTRK